METVLAIILLLCMLAFVVGLVMLFIKPKRKRGLKLMGGSVALGFVCILGSVIVMTELDRNDAPSIASTPAQQEAPQSAQETAEASVPVSTGKTEANDKEDAQGDLGDFPDKAAQMQAQALGISRYAAFTQLGNLEAIKSYCQLTVQMTQTEEAKWAAIDAGGDETALTADAEAKHQALRDEFNAKYGLIDFEFETLAQVGKWRAYCSAFSKGWGVFGDNSAARVEKADAKAATGLIERMYVEELNRPSSQLQASAFKAVTCKRKEVDDRWFTGCQLLGWGGRSGWLVYLLGKSNDGLLFANPISGDSIQFTTAIWPHATTAVRDKLVVGEFTGQRVDITATLEAFE